MKSNRKFKPNAGIFGANLSKSAKSSGSELSGTVKSPSTGSELSGTVKSAKPKTKKRKIKFKAGSELSGTVK